MADLNDTRQRRLGPGTRILRVIAWSLKAKYTHGAATVVIDFNDGGYLLLVRQRFRERNCWGLPGGFLNVGESPEAGARRELHEETGIAADDVALDDVDSYKQHWAWHWEHLYQAAISREHCRVPVRSVEINAIAWYRLSELPRLTVATEDALSRWRIWSAERRDGTERHEQLMTQPPTPAH